MKKLLLLIAGLMIAGTVFSYLFIPGETTIRASVQFAATEGGLKRMLIETPGLGKGWPAETKGDTAFEYMGTTYRLTDKTFSGLTITAARGGQTLTGSLAIIPKGNDTVTLSWETKATASLNPIIRWQNYFRYKNLKTEIEGILGSLQHFYADPVNIYGIKVESQKVTDTSLISTSGTTTGNPDPAFIYSLIDKLKAYAASEGSEATNPPMLNVFTEDSKTFVTKVALPVDRILPNSGNITYKWMLGGGNILVAEIHGGPGAISNAFKSFDLYVADHKRTAPAIPFESLVTNRLQQPDTSKWVTKIYFPVM